MSRSAEKTSRIEITFKCSHVYQKKKKYFAGKKTKRKSNLVSRGFTN